jgi:spore coat protein U-like protein
MKKEIEEVCRRDKDHQYSWITKINILNNIQIQCNPHKNSNVILNQSTRNNPTSRGSTKDQE